MSRKILNITIYFILAILLLAPEIYSQQWVKTVNGTANGDDRVTNAVADKAGNIYVTGYITRTGTGIDFCTVKYNSSGTVQWTKYYDGPGHGEDKAFGIVVDNAGNVYVAGYSKGIGSMSDYTTLKYNSSGTQLWEQRYNTPANDDDRAFGIAVDNAGYVYVTGYVTLANPDIYTVKYSPNGVYLWGHLFTGTGNGEDKAFGIVSDGINVYISGYVKDSIGDYDIATFKYDSSGLVQWSKIYNGPGNSDDRAFGIAVDDSRNYIFVGGYSTGAGTGTDITLIKYDIHNGDTSWVARYNGSGNGDDKAFGMAVDNAGYSYITGSSMGSGSGSDYVTLRYNSAGVQKWASVYNNPDANSEDIAYSIFVPKQLNYVFVTGGSRKDTTTGSEDIVTIRYNISTGEQTQLHKFAGVYNGSDVGVKVLTDTSENVFVAGYTQTGASNYDWITYKFLGANIIGINMISTQVPGEYRLYQNYPNPFNPSTKIRFDIKKSGAVKLVVYDVLGKQTAVLKDDFMKPGTYEAVLNLSGFASGVYYYELLLEGYRDVRKMVMIK